MSPLLCQCYSTSCLRKTSIKNHKNVLLLITKVAYKQLILGINYVNIPESFNTNISHQFFYYKITFANSQLENIDSKGNLVLKNRL